MIELEWDCKCLRANMINERYSSRLSLGHKWVSTVSKSYWRIVRD